MKATMEMITPQMAAEMLKFNTNNYRRLSPAKVNTLAADMKAGKWQANGETIVFSADGTLKDGQHRLSAIVESGVTVPVLIVREVDNAVSIYDCGGNRTVQQWGYANGTPVPTTASSAARVIISGFRGNPPRGVLQDYIQTHYDELKEAARIATVGKKGGIGNKGAVCLCVYIARRLQMMPDETLENFFRIFNTGNVGPDQKRDPSPALVAARQFLTKLPSGSAGAQTKHLEVVMQALLDFKKNRNRKLDYKYDIQMLEYLKEIQRMEGFKPTI